MEEMLAIFIASTLRLAMPLMLAASGELVSERAGVLNLSLEGMMLTAAFFGALGSWAGGNPISASPAPSLASVVVSAVQAWLSVNLRANQLVVGIGFNILALGATTLLYRIIFGGLSREEIPGLPKLAVTGLSDLPFAGTAFFQQSVIVYVGAGADRADLGHAEPHLVRPCGARRRRRAAQRRQGRHPRRRRRAGRRC